ncbi:MAG: aminotransferase class V-fold PLP-dependent enzyme [Phycisphaerales bacterium]|nr:aminotransferase class V-fold PLP-dependent enzyme [Phycisphaerales bacterium]
MTTRARLYLDNAATSFPKPPAVATAVHEHVAHSGGSAGRGAYREAIESGRLFDRCRAAVRTLLGLHPDDGVIFTLNCTDALNLAIKGLTPPGAHVVTSAMDHNSVLRPLAALAQRSGVRFDAVLPDTKSTRLDPRAVADALRPETALVVLSHASNVTGALQPIREIAAACRGRGVPLLLDAAQTAGHVPIDFDELGIDLLACPGHKGLMGPLGTGVLAFRREFGPRIHTLREGGTGSSSELATQPETLPDKFEPGSQNAVGVAGLLAALEWILARSAASLRAHEMELCEEFVERVAGLAGVRLFGPTAAAQRVGVFSFAVEGFEAAETAALLESRFEILTRAGLHCAPLAHRVLATDGTGGLTRASFGAFTTIEDVNRLADALASLAGAAPGVGSVRDGEDLCKSSQD